MTRTAIDIVTEWLNLPADRRSDSISRMQADLNILHVDEMEQGVTTDELSGLLTLRVNEATHAGHEWTAEQLTDCLCDLIGRSATPADV